MILGVIVPTVLGIGILISIAVVLRDVYERLRGPGWMSRRSGRQGRMTAILAVGDDADAGAGDDHLRSGRHGTTWYLVAGVVLGVLAVWLAVGSWGNYIGWRDWLDSIAWIFLVFVAAAVASAVLAVACLLVVLRGGRHPMWVGVILDRTPLGCPPELASVATTVVEHPRHARRRGMPPARPLGPQHVTDRRATIARTVAGVWTFVAVSLVGWMTFAGRIPATPEELDTAVATPVWITLYVALIVSAVVVYRWEVGGAIALAVCAGLLGFLSSFQYPPAVAFLLIAVFAVPAFLHWLAWEREHHVHHLVAVAAWTTIAVVLTTFGANQVHDHYFGPTHPASEVVDPAPSPVVWAWVGSTTARSTEVVARVRQEGPVRLMLSRSADLTDPLTSPTRTADASADHVVRLGIDGLRPATTYHWAIEVRGEVDRVRSGTLRTMPEGPASFTLAVGACARSGSDGAVFDSIRRRRPLAYLQLGDLHYANIGEDEPARFQEALDQVLTEPAQAALYRSTSIAYVWDDHDYSANDGDETATSRPAAERVYRAWVPHHPLVSDSPEGPIGQSFVAGRVRIIMTDTRSQRTAPGVARGREQQMLGVEQEAWFAEELRRAHDSGQVVVWAGSSPWIGPSLPGGDTWAGYPDARRRAADLIAASSMQDRLVAVAGDAHMVALDDGSHTDYSTGRAGGFPLLHAAALDRPGSVKGGPYSGGVHPGGGQFGEIEVDDEGGATLTITLKGRTWDDRTLVEQTFVLPVG